jgi:hypothetical protein
VLRDRAVRPRDLRLEHGRLVQADGLAVLRDELVFGRRVVDAGETLWVWAEAY